MSFSRRQFLQAASLVAFTPSVIYAQQQEQDELANIKKEFEELRQLQYKKSGLAKDADKLESIFKDVKLTDQYGQPIDPASLFAKGPALLMFGRSFCDMCEKIGRTASAIQEEMDRQGTTIPIIVVSVTPEKDRFHEEGTNPMKQYVEAYGRQNVRQFQQKDTSYTDGKDTPQKDRLLHLACAQSGSFPKSKYSYPQTVENRVGEIFKGMTNLFNPNDPESHSQYVTLFQNGRAALTLSTLPELEEVYDENKKDAALGEHAKKCAKFLVHEALHPAQSIGR